MNKLLQVIAEAHRFGNIIYHNRLETPEHNTERNHEYYKNRTQCVKKLGETQNLLAKIKGYQHFHALQALLDDEDSVLINNDLKQNLLVSNAPIATIPFIEHYFEPIIKEKSFCDEEETIPTSLFERKLKIQQKEQKDLIIGDLGSGIEYFVMNDVYSDIENNEPSIVITANGEHHLLIDFISLLNNKKQIQNAYILNFLTHEDVVNKYDSINPIDMWLISQSTFEKTFPQAISNWLYPALIHLKSKGLKLSLGSIVDIVSLSTVISMAKNNDFNNQEQANKYLKLIGFNVDKTDDKDIEKALNNHIYQLSKSLDIISCIQHFYKLGHFSDKPTINLMHIFARRKYLIVSIPRLDVTIGVSEALNQLLNSLILGAEKLNNSHYCQNIYCVSNRMFLTKEQENSPNKFVIGQTTPYEFKKDDLIHFNRIMVRKVFKLPKAIQEIIFDNYFSSDYPESLNFIYHENKINIFDSNNKRRGKYGIIKGLIYFHTKENKPAKYITLIYKRKMAKGYISTFKHTGDLYE